MKKHFKSSPSEVLVYSINKVTIVTENTITKVNKLDIMTKLHNVDGNMNGFFWIIGNTNDFYRMTGPILTKKCQPAARDTPHSVLSTLVHGTSVKEYTVGVPDSRLACPKKSTERKKYENTNKTSSSTLDCQFCIPDNKWITGCRIPTGRTTTPTKTKKGNMDGNLNKSYQYTGYAESKLEKGKSNNQSRLKIREILMRSQSHLKIVREMLGNVDNTGGDTCPPQVGKHFVSNKSRNKSVKMINGNRKNSVQIAHWNLGSKRWKNKRDQIQALVDLKSPDLIFISEANLDEMTPEYETIIQSYNINKPKTISDHRISRLILLLREQLKFTIEDKFMSKDIASIWVTILKSGARRVLVAGVYREHQSHIQ